MDGIFLVHIWWRFMRAAGLLISLMTVPSLIFAHQQFNLLQTIDYASTHSPDLSQAEREKVITWLRKRNAIAEFWPSVDLTSQHGYYHDRTVGGGNAMGSNISLRFVQKIYDNGVSIIENRQATYQNTVSIFEYLDKRDKLIRDVANNYLDLSLQKRLYKIEQANLSNLRKQYQKALNQYQHGIKLSQDVIRFNSQVRNAELQVLSSKNQVENARQTLFKTMGVPLGSPLVELIRFEMAPIPQFKRRPIPTEGAKVEEHVRYRINDLKRKINALDVRLEKRTLYPQLNLTSNAGYTGTRRSGLFSSYAKGNATLGWDINLEIQYNIFDFGTRRRNVHIARENELKQRDQLNRELQELRNDMKNNILVIQRRGQAYRVSTELLASENKSYAILLKNYRSGSAQYVDLINGINDLLSAKRQYMADRYSLAKDLNEYHYFKGTIYENIMATH